MNLQSFLGRHGWGEAALQSLAGDASSRRYWRATRPESGETAIVSHSPTPEADCWPFVAIGRFLSALELSTPRVRAESLNDGFLLLEDFGDASFFILAQDSAQEATLYRSAVDVLIHLHGNYRLSPAYYSDAKMIAAAAEAIAAGIMTAPVFPDVSTTRPAIPGPNGLLPLPVYDVAAFVEQVMLFPDVYCSAVMGGAVSDAARSAFEAAWREVLPIAVAGPWSLVLRDYHFGNLMSLPDREGVGATGLLDFQSAGPGPVAYDLVSLLEDARRDVPNGLVEEMIARYLDAFPLLDRQSFLRSYVVFSAVRHTRVLAVFARLALRDGKRGYLSYMARVWRLLEASLCHAALAPVAAWFDHYVPTGARAGAIFSEPA
ncbi:N-acetylmuramate 1-kinase [Azospirillaceae bacterium]